MSTLSRWLQPPPKDSLEQQYQDLANQLRAKERALETTAHDLKVKTAALQVLEQKIMASETQFSSAQRELTSRSEQLKALEAELAVRSSRVADLEAEGIAARQQVSELNSIIATQVDELHRAQQAHEVLKEEIRVLRDHIAQLNESLADRDHLRARLEKLEAVQDRVHQLEVELSDREAAHRGILQQLEQAIAERDQRIRTVDASAAAQAEELRSAHQACRAADHAQEVLKEEIRVLRDHIAQLNESLADRDHLRARLEKLEAVQDRVHQLEVELSDREAAHRGILQQLEQAIAERDQQIRTVDASAAAQAEELRSAHQACRAADHAQEVLKEEIRVLRDHIAQLNQDLADRDRLRAHLAKLESVQGRVHQLEVELSDREAAHRGILQQLEQAIAERDQRIRTVDASAAAQAEELRSAHQACRAADHAQEVLKEEIRVLRDHIAQLNESLADRDHLRARLEKLEAVQDRVHQLEVELSDREAAHRGILQQLEQAIAERDARIKELVPATHLLREKESELKEWEKKYARIVQEHRAETAKLQDQCAVQEQLREQLSLSARQLQERDEQTVSLTRQLEDLQAERHTLVQQVQGIPEKEEHIDRLQKRLKELRAALRAAPNSATPPAQSRRNGAGSNVQARQPKAGKNGQGDDLKKIGGIGPVFADTLNKMGTRTFIQIARWKPEDIQKIAKKLDTDPERITREKWIADAKKQHYRKYGERV